MATIVKYTDQQSTRNAYPVRIISPTHAAPCCFTDMDPVGRPEADGEWVVQYWRCRHCGFTVRRVRYAIPDPALLASIRAAFKTLFRPRGRAA
jgi:hypothetical protein